MERFEERFNELSQEIKKDIHSFKEEVRQHLVNQDNKQEKDNKIILADNFELKAGQRAIQESLHPFIEQAKKEAAWREYEAGLHKYGWVAFTVVTGIFMAYEGFIRFVSSFLPSK
jgi:hypothetical protein